MGSRLSFGRAPKDLGRAKETTGVTYTPDHAGLITPNQVRQAEELYNSVLFSGEGNAHNDATDRLSEEDLLSLVDAFYEGEVSIIEAAGVVDKIVAELLRLRLLPKPGYAPYRVPAPQEDATTAILMVALKRMGGKMEITDGERAGWMRDYEVEAARDPNDYVTQYRLRRVK